MQKLALAVLRQALDDAERRDAVGALARGWLRSDAPWLRFWCMCAGVSLRQLDRRLSVGPPCAPAVMACDDEEDDGPQPPTRC